MMKDRYKDLGARKEQSEKMKAHLSNPDAYARRVEQIKKMVVEREARRQARRGDQSS